MIRVTTAAPSSGSAEPRVTTAGGGAKALEAEDPKVAVAKLVYNRLDVWYDGHITPTREV